MFHSPWGRRRQSLLTIMVPAVPAPSTSSFFTDCSSALWWCLVLIHHARKHSHLGTGPKVLLPQGVSHTGVQGFGWTALRVSHPPERLRASNPWLSSTRVAR